MHWLDEKKIPYQTLDVIGDPKANDEMVRLSGQTFAPTIDVDGKILADFGPEELAAFWEKISAGKKAMRHLHIKICETYKLSSSCRG